MPNAVSGIYVSKMSDIKLQSDAKALIILINQNIFTNGSEHQQFNTVYIPNFYFSNHIVSRQTNLLFEISREIISFSRSMYSIEDIFKVTQIFKTLMRCKIRGKEIKQVYSWNLL